MKPKSDSSYFNVELYGNEKAKQHCKDINWNFSEIKNDNHQNNKEKSIIKGLLERTKNLNFNSVNRPIIEIKKPNTIALIGALHRSHTVKKFRAESKKTRAGIL